MIAGMQARGEPLVPLVPLIWNFPTTFRKRALMCLRGGVARGVWVWHVVAWRAGSWRAVADCLMAMAPICHQSVPHSGKIDPASRL